MRIKRIDRELQKSNDAGGERGLLLRKNHLLDESEQMKGDNHLFHSFSFWRVAPRHNMHLYLFARYSISCYPHLTALFYYFS